jgi:hypothetical protein
MSSLVGFCQSFVGRRLGSVRFPDVRPKRALQVETVAVVAENQKYEAACGDAGGGWDVLGRSWVYAGMRSDSRLVLVGLAAIGATFALALAFILPAVNHQTSKQTFQDHQR